MRFLLGAAVAAASFLAVPTFAAGPPIVQFNGFSVTVEAGKAAGLDPIEAVTSKAVEACASVGKSARLEEERQVRAMRFHYFFVCL